MDHILSVHSFTDGAECILRCYMNRVSWEWDATQIVIGISEVGFAASSGPLALQARPFFFHCVPSHRKTSQSPKGWSQWVSPTNLIESFWKIQILHFPLSSQLCLPPTPTTIRQQDWVGMRASWLGPGLLSWPSSDPCPTPLVLLCFPPPCTMVPSLICYIYSTSRLWSESSEAKSLHSVVFHSINSYCMLLCSKHCSFWVQSVQLGTKETKAPPVSAFLLMGTQIINKIGEHDFG